MLHIVSTRNNCWREGDKVENKVSDNTLEVTGEYAQSIQGFGGCFNELGWDSLQKVSKEKRQEFFDELFSSENCGFNYGRVPVGANDFSLEWYSCDETPQDYDLKDFNIERDKEYTIPYVKEAMKRCSDMTLFASPWSPPTWMKTKKAYNYGTINMEDKILDTYARYLLKFVEQYKEEGIHVNQIHIQNEPMADQKFPSCKWSGEDMKRFIKDYMGPEIEKSGVDVELWLGTINGPYNDYMPNNEDSGVLAEFYDQFANTILGNKETRKYLQGVGVQWGGKHILEQVHLSFPKMHIMQTESECGNGQNTWEHMEYIFRQMWFYFRHGAEKYTYWNMALELGGISTWGWTQNSLVTIDASSGEMIYNPEFFLMKHFSHFVKPGAKYLPTKGHWAANSLVFENPEGEIVIIVGSNMNEQRDFSFTHHNINFSCQIEPHSIHTFLVNKEFL